MLHAQRIQTPARRLTHARLGPILSEVQLRRLLAGLAACLLLLMVVLADHWLGSLVLDEAGARAQDEVVLGLSGRVAPADFQAPIDPVRLAGMQARLHPLLSVLTQPGSGILRVNLISFDGTVVYSSQPELNGMALPVQEHHQLSDALSGSISIERSSLQSAENRDLGARYTSAIEVYVPVRIDGTVVGAYEIYQDAGLLRATRLLVWLAGAALLVLPFLLASLLKGGRRDRQTPPLVPTRAVGAQAPASEAVRLTPRELQVLRLMAEHTTRDIAEELVLSEETVRTHIKSIRQKLNCSNRTAAVLVADRMGLLKVPRQPE